MNKTEREEIRRLTADFRQWSQFAEDVQAWRQAVQDAASSDERTLRSRSVMVGRAGQAAWRVLALRPSDMEVVRRLWERATLPVPASDDRALLHLLTTDAPRAVADVSPMLGVRRFFTGSAKKQSAGAASEFLRHHHAAFLRNDGPRRLERLGAFTAPLDPGRLGFEALLDPALRFDLVSGQTAPAPEILDRSVVDGLPEALDAIAKVVAGEASYRSAAKEAGEKVRGAEVQRILQEMPVDALKTATRDRLRLGPLTEAGVSTVQEVLNVGLTLQALPGVGETSARRMLGAAQTLWQTTYDEMPVRIDINHRHPETTQLLRCLAEWDSCRQTRGAAADLERASELAPLRAALGGGASHLLVIPARQLAAAGLAESIQIVKRRAELLGMSSVSGRKSAGADPWDDFLARPADYFAMLSELGFVTEDEDAVHGDLPEEIIQAVRDQALDGEHLTASLRGYQSFAARFALVQRKVIIGDEMGLGKTVEAIAVLAHLRSRGKTHFLVVCPAAVVTNWVREVTAKSRLRPHRVHGPERDRAARAWMRDGGVAITTYETLAWWEPALRELRDLACVVVDEAHYIKNPQARRTIRTKQLVARSERAILLTGTPLENKVDEFRNLASYVRPDLTVDATDLSPKRFRRQIAPAYLRRNQEDVLTELPELIEVEEWLPMSAADISRYRAAVQHGNFMAMRQAAMLQGHQSAKVQRLIEIVREAEENERRVIVFSHFREVLDLVARSLPGPVFGPLTGSVPASHRQQLVDQFSSARHGAVLVAQIVAGGVGLNIQSASVVVICEPQLKPTTEAQAIARAHRMGQVQSVQVHRLLSEDSVDQRITELLAGKKQLFNEFARVSDMADSTPEAVDLSEAELVREVVAAERQRLFNRAAAEA
ncbi:SNF2 family N-terminal domain-containing protein [Micromonospora viridifaciens]|uniref:SNF2 family N-terminal domain-containing protein n=1 Tax=Micromonospora viridifaciens TaxID=1881 RepID=A0A1C4XKC5_MICVI|nr:SNF2 family N-terminal domain-containing protein [Micromonospora viridifaciens]